MDAAIVAGIAAIITLLLNRLFDSRQAKIAFKKAEATERIAAEAKELVKSLEHEKFVDQKMQRLIEGLYKRVEFLEKENEAMHRQLAYLMQYLMLHGIPVPSFNPDVPDAPAPDDPSHTAP